MNPMFARFALAALLLVSLHAGCAVKAEGKDLLPPKGDDLGLSVDTARVGTQSLCTAQATCGSCTTLSCSGQSTCTSQDGSSGFVTCDNVTNHCKTCTYNGRTYTDGQTVTVFTLCSSKLDGYCIGGPLAGQPCVSSGDCDTATCCNGTWSML